MKQHENDWTEVAAGGGLTQGELEAFQESLEIEAHSDLLRRRHRAAQRRTDAAIRRLLEDFENDG
jgi:hypothetical protein